MPYGLAPPANLSAAGENLSLIQLSSHGIEAELLLGVHRKHPAHHLSLRFHHLVITRRGVAFLHVVVAVRGPGKHIHHSLLRLVPFSPATPFGDLGTLILRYHPLKLHYQLILGGGPGWGLEKNQIHTTTGELFCQQNLIGILTAQPVRRIHQNRHHLALRCQVTQRL